jgi:hypothetical protein
MSEPRDHLKDKNSESSERMRLNVPAFEAIELTRIPISFVPGGFNRKG